MQINLAKATLLLTKTKTCCDTLCGQTWTPTLISRAICDVRTLCNISIVSQRKALSEHCKGFFETLFPLLSPHANDGCTPKIRLARRRFRLSGFFWFHSISFWGHKQKQCTCAESVARVCVCVCVWQVNTRNDGA